MSKYLDSVGLEELWGIIKSTFAASISIDGRTISLKNKSGNTLGSTITIPSTATSLATAGTIQIDLASTSSVTYTSGGNITPGVKNALKVANGGTGKNSLDSGKALIGNGTNAVTLRSIYTRTESGDLEWTSGTNEYLITKGALAYWNGAYGTTGKSNITTLGTITTGVWNGTAIDVDYGGTGVTSNPSMLVNLASTTADTVFETSPRPGVTGTLGIGNGGTGLTSSPSMLVKLDSTTADTILKASPRPGITGTLGVSHGGTGQTSAKDASNAFINALDTETTALQDGDYFIAQTAGGGTTTTTYKRKPLSALETYIRSATVDYFTCDTASGTVAKNVTVNKTLRYYEGAEFIVKFTNGNTVANPTFSVNSLAARPIYLNGLPVPTDYIKSGDIVRFVYHDTSFDIIDRGLDTIKAYDNHIRYYIHRTNGSDTNDGLTTSTPFKTIEKFLEVTANAGYTDCRCTILKDGAYVLNKQALNNVTLHIKVDDSVNGDVILQGNYNVPEDWIMYNAHVKLTGTANAPIVYQPYSTQGIYFENSAVTLDYVKFKCRMQGFGCYIKADNIEANTLHFSGCTGYLATVAITNNSHTRHGILLDRGCNMRVSGTFTIGALTDGVASSDSNKDKNYFLNIQDSDIVLQSSYPTTLYNFNNNSTIDITNNSNRTTYSYAYGMRLSNAEITGTRIRLASYVSRGVNKTMLADEESDINVTWGGGSGDSANGRAGFNSLYGLESIVLNTDATDLVSASAIKTWTIPKATIVSAIASDHPNVGTSAYPYKILAVVPVSTNDNRVIIKNSTVNSTTGDITVVGRNVTSSNLQNLGIFATVSILYTMSPFSITYHS